VSPGQAREILTDAEQATEQVMLLTRLSAGCPVSHLSNAGRAAAAAAVADGLATQDALDAGFVRLTRQGRLLADAVIRKITS
jgi:oxygen-independent coproporphyrinogen-3 oxidase